MNRRTVLGVFAHPDDAETLCAGTMILLHRKGWDIHIATLTPGDCGSKDLPREEISLIRCNEANQAAGLIGGTYHCLEFDDLFIMYDKPTLLKTVALIRMVRPTIVFTTSPSDYHIDHETTSKLTRVACFAAGVPNIKTDGAESFEPVPYLYYLDTVLGRDAFGKDVTPQMRVDISSVIDIKAKMLSCHESQQQWISAHHGDDEYIATMKKNCRRHGRVVGCKYAEGFRQHLDEAFPKDNILKTELGDVVHINKDY